LAIIILHAITGVCTPACLLAASISVEAVTPPLVGLAILKEQFPDYGGNLAKSIDWMLMETPKVQHWFST